MDISASARSYPLQDVMDFKDVFYILGTRSIVLLIVRTRVVV